MIHLSKIAHIDDIGTLWKSLEATANCSFFVSWPWIRTWWCAVRSYVEPELLTISYNGNIIAAAFVVRRSVRRRGLMNVETLVLNATGDPKLDELFIEYNGLLTSDENLDRAWLALSTYLHQKRAEWEEFQMPGISPRLLKFWKGSSFSIKEQCSRSTRYVDLLSVRATGSDFTCTLGKKPRAHVRYTRESFSRFGELRVQKAGSLTEAREFYEQLKEMNLERWRDRGVSAAFSHPFFDEFHVQLIENHFGAGVIQLIRVTAGAQVVGVLYNFVHGDGILVYQSGFNYALVKSRNKESPGLLTHVLAIESNMADGFKRYDLLAGDSEYKRVLAKEVDDLWWGHVQRDRFKFKLETMIEGLWRSVKTWTFGVIVLLMQCFCDESLEALVTVA
jgi:CelD/BcsL family acetyltransferase involved in cellulose biosynthesis